MPPRAVSGLDAARAQPLPAQPVPPASASRLGDTASAALRSCSARHCPSRVPFRLRGHSSARNRACVRVLWVTCVGSARTERETGASQEEPTTGDKGLRRMESSTRKVSPPHVAATSPRGRGLASHRLRLERAVLPWMCLLILEAALVYALNTGLVARFSAQDARASHFERAATKVYVLDDDDGTACNGAGCGHWVTIGCGQWVPRNAERLRLVRRAVHDDEESGSCDGAPGLESCAPMPGQKAVVAWRGRRCP